MPDAGRPAVVSRTWQVMGSLDAMVWLGGGPVEKLNMGVFAASLFFKVLFWLVMRPVDYRVLP